MAAPLCLGRGQACAEIQLVAGEPFGDQHDAGTVGTSQAGCLGRIDAGRRAEQSAAAFERSTSSAVGEQSEVADANQASREDVKQEAAQKLMGGNGHDLLLAAVRIVSPAEGDAAVFKSHEAMVGDGYAMGIAGQVVENMFRAAERWLGIDDPILLAKLKPILREELLQSSDELAAEDSA